MSGGIEVVKRIWLMDSMGHVFDAGVGVARQPLLLVAVRLLHHVSVA